MFFRNRVLLPAVFLAGLVTLSACGSNNSVQSLTATVPPDLTTLEDTPLEITISGAEPGRSGVSLQVKILQPPVHGSFDISAGGSPLKVTYTPDANWSGVDSFEYEVTTDDQRSDLTGNATITVTPVADPPVLAASASGDEDTLIPLLVSAALFDTDGSEDLSTVVISGVPDGITLTGSQVSYFGNGVYSVPPNGLADLAFASQADLDIDFFITIEANSTETETAETALTTLADIEVFITPVADAPVPAAVQATTDEDSYVDITLSATDVDHNDDPLTTGIVEVDTPDLVGFTGLAAGSSVTNTDSSPITFPVPLPVTVRYVAAPDLDVTDTFSYVVQDDFGLQANGAVTISVTPSPDAPAAAPQNVQVSEDSTVTFTLSGTDPDTGDVLTLTSLPVAPGYGTLKTLGGAALAGALPLVTPVTVRYTPFADSDLDDSFDFTLTDSGALTSTATVTIDVVPVADAPHAFGATTPVNENSFVDFTIDGSDPDTVDSVNCAGFGLGESDGAIRILGVVQPLNGVVTDQADGALSLPSAAISEGVGNGLAVRYRPNLNYYGHDFTTFTVTDRCGLTHSASVNFTVDRVPQAPTAPTLAATSDEDSYVLVQINLTNDPSFAATQVVDPDILDGDTVKLTAVGAPGNGQVKDISGNALVFPVSLPTTLRYVPSANYNGGDSFSFTVGDLQPGTTAGGTVNVTVNPVNDAPSVSNLNSGEPLTEVNCATGGTPAFQGTGDDSIDGPGPWALTFSRNGGTCSFGTVAADGTVGGLCPVLGSACTIGLQVTDGTASTTRFLRIHYNTRFVSTVATGAKNGTSWSNATNNLQQATDDLIGVTGGQVWVKRGTYRSTGTGQVLSLPANVEVYGGLLGTELNLSQRPGTPMVQSVLTGDTDSSGTATAGDSYHVVLANGDNSVLDGFTVTGGNAVGTGFLDDSGGAMVVNGSSNVTIRNSIFQNNKAPGVLGTNGSGGALTIYDGTVNMTDSQVIGNDSPGAVGGGAVHVIFFSTLSLNRVKFISNTATAGPGGAIYLTESTLYAYDSDFLGNAANTEGGAIYSAYFSYVVLTNSSFVNNSAASGGAVFIFSDSSFSSTQTELGNLSFSSNSATGGGGALYVLDDTGEQDMFNTAFYNNSSAFGNPDLYEPLGPVNQQNNCGAPFVMAASGEVFLDQAGSCKDFGNDGIADLFFGSWNGIDWRTLTTDRDTVNLDSSPVDAGRHYPPNRVWIRTFAPQSATVLNWTTNVAASCQLSGGALASPVAVSILGPYTPGGPGTYTLTCQGNGGPVTATTSLP